MKCCICAIAKHENDYINDWIYYHLNLGFDEIFIYDNNELNYEYVGNRISKNYTNRVTIIPANNMTYGFQVKVYTEFYNEFKYNYDWMAFLDIDEFIVLNKHNNIKTFLNTIKNYPVLRLSWQIYGDDGILNGDVKIPIYKRIHNKLDHIFNKNGKCIVKGGISNVNFESSHYPMINGILPKQCFPSGKPVNDAKATIGEPEYDIAYIAHYMTKTWEEFKKQKLNRTDAGYDRKLTIEYFKRINPNTKV